MSLLLAVSGLLLLLKHPLSVGWWAQWKRSTTDEVLIEATDANSLIHFPGLESAVIVSS